MSYFKFFAVFVLVTSISLYTSKKKPSVKLVEGLSYADTLIYNLTTEPHSLDWNKATDRASAIVIFNIMEPLLGFDLTKPELPLEPRLATQWLPFKGGKEWLFHLREDVKWSDGVPFKAQHVYDSFERLLNPATAASGASWFYEVVGAKDYNKGNLKDFSKVGIKIEEKFKIRFLLNRKLAYFPNLLAIQNTIPIRKGIISKHGDKWTEVQNIVTLGAYKLNGWRHDNYLILKKNSEYVLSKKPTINQILLRIISDESTGVNLFERGQIDVQPTIPVSDLYRLKDKPYFKSGSEYTISFIGFNTKKKPFDNPAVRQAFSMAIDRKEIAQVLGGYVTANRAWLPPGLLGYDEKFGMIFNPDQARTLLAQAGYGAKSYFPKAVIAYNTSSNHRLVIENIHAQLKKNLGINLEIQNKEWKTYLDQINTDPPAMFRMGWIALFPDPAPMLEIFRSDSGYNRFFWKNKEMDRLLTMASSALDKSTRYQHIKRIQEIISIEQVPAFALYSSNNKYLVADRVQGFSLNPLDRVEFRLIKFKKGKVQAN